MSPSPEERAQWRREAVNDLSSGFMHNSGDVNRILALLDALDEVQRERDDFEREFQRADLLHTEAYYRAERAEQALAEVEAHVEHVEASLRRAAALLALGSSGRVGTVTAEGFPFGLRCGECHRVIGVGEPYAERLLDVEVAEDRVAGESVLLVCGGCA